MTAPTQSLKTFMLNVALWLPLGFFLWFYLAPILLMPVKLAVELVLTGLWSDAFHEVTRDGLTFMPGALLQLPEGLAVASIPIYPMIYGYGLPLAAGLIVSTPLPAKRRMIQLLLALIIIMLVQVWGSVWETMRTLAFDFGDPGAAALAKTGVPPTVIAFCYQLGYLILPAITPVILWIALNRDFIEGLIRAGSEPQGHEHGQ